MKEAREALGEAIDFIDDLGDLPLERMTLERVDGVFEQVKSAFTAAQEKNS